MTVTEYLISIGLIALVVRQLRGKPLTVTQLLWPLGLVGWAAVQFLHGVPTSGNDLALVVLCAGVGAGLGVASGLLTRVHRRPDGVLVARATGTAAALWIVGAGARMAFALYAEHGGGAVIARISAAYHVTSAQTWAAALILMALAEVVGRTVVLALRAWSARHHDLPATGLPAPLTTTAA